MKKSTEPAKNRIVIYQSKNGAIELRKDAELDTLWASQANIADIFGAERSVVTKHIRNILKDKELNRDSVCANFAHTAEDGKRYQVQFYNLDVVLAVGYRTNSAKAIEFRKWAIKTLREYIVKGYALNKNRIAKNYNAFLQAVAEVKNLLSAGTAIDNASMLDLITLFADTWFSLDAFDKDALVTRSSTRKRVALAAERLSESIAELKTMLVSQGLASDLFGVERTTGNVAGIVGNVMQSFDGKELYPTVEEKAAHLLYFIVKNHPFIDGNKRGGAYAFIWFLRQAGLLDTGRITPAALTAITLLIAESNPKHKDKMVNLIRALI